MTARLPVFAAVLLAACRTTGASAPASSEAGRDRITILYDAFGRDAGMRKDWGFSALVEVGGRRILFDTGDDPDVFAANVRAKGVDLRQLDFVVMSHRHGDHMGGLAHLLAVAPKVKIYAPKEGFGVYGSSLPSTFYRKDESLPRDMRYFDGSPPDVMRFGSAWPGASFELVDKTTEVAPGVWLIALVSDATGTKELKELSLAIDTGAGAVLVVGCSHPGIEAIVEAASAAIRKPIALVVGGLHLVTASDEVIARIATSLHDRWNIAAVAPGHCTGEPTFSALRRVFGDRYHYAGVGTVLPVPPSIAARAPPGEAAPMAAEDLATYRRLARSGLGADRRSGEAPRD